MYNEQELIYDVIDKILSLDDFDLEELYKILKYTYFFNHLTLSSLDYQLTLMRQNGEIGSFDSLEYEVKKLTTYYCKIR